MPAMMSVMLLAASPLLASAFAPAGACPRPASGAAARACAPAMDETIIQKALSGDLEQEGAENVFMSELGWATYLDKNAESSYNLNERPSKASDGYFTPDIFSNPVEVAVSWFDSMKGVVADPLAKAFPTITNDPVGARSYPKGSTEINARTIKPKVKDFNKDMRITGIPGFNAFGTPSSKQETEDTGKFFGIPWPF